MSSELKVTECWAHEEDSGKPRAISAQSFESSDCESRPAVLLWREDYDAMRKELEEYKKVKEYMQENWNNSYRQTWGSGKI